jgi:hypothetical protein
MGAIARLTIVLTATVAAGLTGTALPAQAVDRPATRTICVGVTPHSWGDRPGLPETGVTCFDIEQPGGTPPAPEPASCPKGCLTYLVVFRTVAAADVARAVVLRDTVADGMLKKICDRRYVRKPDTCQDKYSQPKGMLKQFATAAELLAGASIEVEHVGYLRQPGNAAGLKELDWLHDFTTDLADGVTLYARALAAPANAASYHALALDRFDAADAQLADVFLTG